MKLYSDAFLNDSYLKYVGWTMHDKVSYGQSLVYVLTIKLNQRKANFVTKLGHKLNKTNQS